MFKLSKKSLNNLNGVKPELIECVKYAITISRIDFAVIEGVRTLERQKQLVAAGASQTMKSKHLTGDAVDLAAFVGDRISWELNLYDDIADAMKAAAMDLKIPITWGGAWNIINIAEWNGTMQDAMNFYIDTRRSEGKKPFIDGPHFQLADDV